MKHFNFCPKAGLLCVAVFFSAVVRSPADVVYDSGGFESPRFNSGVDLNGQDPVMPPVSYGPWHKDAGTSAALVQTDVPNGGLQSIQVIRTNAVTGDTRWGIVVPITPTLSNNVVAIDFDLNSIITPGTNWGGPDLGPLFGVECYDNSSGTAKLIGSVLHDAYSGAVLYQQAGSGNLQSSGTFIPRNQYHHYTVAANFRNKTYSVFVDGNLIHTEGFVDTTATNFTDAPITVLAETPASAATATGTAYFENYKISLTSSRLDYLVWRGDGVSNNWDFGSSNWFNGDFVDVFSNNIAVVFDDTGSNAPSINLQGNLQPAAVLVNATQPYTFDGSGGIAGPASLLKRGSSILVVNNANTYSGGTIVSNGTLLVNNASGSGTGTGDVSIRSGATIGGSGVIAASLTVSGGGIVSPGHDVGTLTINGRLILSNSSTMRFDLGAPSDQLSVAGDLTLAGALEITAATGFGVGRYTLITYSGALSGPGTSISMAPSGFDYTLDTNTPGQVFLVVTPPPVPPAAPSGLAATSSSDRVDLTWNDNSTNETQFLVERSLNNSVFAQVGSVGTGVTNYSDTGLNPSTAYYYRVRASNSGGNSPYSSTLAVTTLFSTNPPVAYYKFEFNTLDSSGNNNDGVPAGGLLYGQGKVGDYAGQFDGLSASIEILPVARTNMTMAVWVQTTNFFAGASNKWYEGGGLVDGETTGNNSDWGSSILNGRFCVGIGSSGGSTVVSSGVTVNDGQWHHLVAARESATGLVKLFVDGRLNALIIAPAGPRGAPNELTIGRSHNPTPVFFNGKIDDLRFYDRVLNDAEIAILAGRAARIANLRTDGHNAVINGAGGPPSGTYYVLASTNIALPLAQWRREATNRFDDSGNCTYTNAMDTAEASKFFLLQLP